MQSPINPSNLNKQKKNAFQNGTQTKCKINTTTKTTTEKGTNPHLDLNKQEQNQLQKSPQPKENPVHLNLPGKGTIFRERLRIQQRKTRGLPENK